MEHDSEITKKVREAIVNAADTLKKLSDELKEIANNFKGDMRQTSLEAKTELLKLEEKIEPMVKGKLKEIAVNFKENMQLTAQETKGALQKYEGKIVPVKGKIKEIAKDLKEDMIKTGENAKADLKKIELKIKGTKVKAQDLSSKAVNTAKDIVKGVKEGIKDVKKEQPKAAGTHYCLSKILIEQVTNKKGIQMVEKLAREIWTEHFIPIIGEAQVNYMLELFQSQKAIEEQISKGHQYCLIKDPESNNIGYFAVLPESKGMFLSKFYILEKYRGKGYGKEAMEFIYDMAAEKQLSLIYLTVNKNNIDSIARYQKYGFVISGPSVTDIGMGFKMDDFRMDKTLK